MITNANNMFLRLHVGEHNYYEIKELESVELPDSIMNDCGVFLDRAMFVLLDTKKDYVVAEVARHGNLFYSGYDYEYPMGGGCSGPSIHNKPFNSVKEALLYVMNLPFLNKRYNGLCNLAKELKIKSHFKQLEIDW